MAREPETHWNDVYERKSEDELSWHQDAPEASLQMIARAGTARDAAVIDVGGGTSPLAGALLEDGWRDVTVLDVSEVALARARAGLGPRGGAVTWIAADITAWQPPRHYALWHDRAVFHFLTEAADRAAYLRALSRALPPGGHAVIATFGPDGPETCSGLPVVRYSPAALARTLGPGFELRDSRDLRHRTPWGASQAFQYSLLRRIGTGDA